MKLLLVFVVAVCLIAVIQANVAAEGHSDESSSEGHSDKSSSEGHSDKSSSEGHSVEWWISKGRGRRRARRADHDWNSSSGSK